MRRRDLLKGLLALPFLGFLKPLVEAKGDIVHIDFTGEYEKPVDTTLDFTREFIRSQDVPINNPPNWPGEPGYLVIDGQRWQENNNALFSKEILSKYAEEDVRLTREIKSLQDGLDSLKNYKGPVDYGRRVQELLDKHPGLTFQMIADHTGYNVKWLESVSQYSKLTRQAAKLYRDQKISLTHARLLREVDRNHQFAFLEEAQNLSYYDFSFHVEQYFLLKNKEGIKAVFDPVRTEYGVKRKYHNKDGQSRTFFHRYSNNDIQQLTKGHPVYAPPTIT